MNDKFFFRVREFFSVKLGEIVHEAGAILHLNRHQFLDHQHKLEEVSAEEAEREGIATRPAPSPRLPASRTHPIRRWRR